MIATWSSKEIEATQARVRTKLKKPTDLSTVHLLLAEKIEKTSPLKILLSVVLFAASIVALASWSTNWISVDVGLLTTMLLCVCAVLSYGLAIFKWKKLGIKELPGDHPWLLVALALKLTEYFVGHYHFDAQFALSLAATLAMLVWCVITVRSMYKTRRELLETQQALTERKALLVKALQEHEAIADGNALRDLTNIYVNLERIETGAILKYNIDIEAIKSGVLTKLQAAGITTVEEKRQSGAVLEFTLNTPEGTEHNSAAMSLMTMVDDIVTNARLEKYATKMSVPVWMCNTLITGDFKRADTSIRNGVFSSVDKFIESWQSDNQAHGS